MGTVRTNLVHFCPVDDEVTLEAIVAQLELRIKLESQIEEQGYTISEEW